MIQYLMSKIPTLPTFPDYPYDAVARGEYEQEVQAVEAWVKSPALLVTLAKAVQDNNLIAYLQLEKLWLRTRGCGNKRWREMVESLLL